MMRVFVSKYAMSGGIDERDVSQPQDGYVYTAKHRQQFKLGRDAFVDRADAVASAEKMRVAKIASLKKQIAKLEKLTFAA